MDFGAADLEGLARTCSVNAASNCNNGGFSFEGDKDKQSGFGSGFLKRDRGVNEMDFRGFKVGLGKSSSYGEALLKVPSGSGHQQMLSFSSPTAPPYYHRPGMNSAGTFSRTRVPFTPSQWMELEHQALIYKHIAANVPVSSYLLNPIRKTMDSGLRSSPFGWGAFHVGFSNADPEPGRCRRTDGKKWRCSRDAVADQKYCERHINRGRHRSRKPVEAQSGHAAAAPAPAMNDSNPPVTSTGPATSTSTPGGAAPNSLTLSHHQLRSLSGSELLVSSFNREEDNSYSMSMPKQQDSFQELGLLCSDSLLNPLHSRTFAVSDNQTSNKSPENHSLNLDQTRLSISIPMADFSFSAPTASKLQRLSQELEMGLGVGQHNQRHDANWVPISWEPSIAGPLGEVVHNTSNTAGDALSTKPLNLMDSSPSYLAATSPTGVISRGGLGSLSNSSAGSSPRAELPAFAMGSFLAS